MTAMQRFTLALRVLMEAGVVVGLAYWGARTGEGAAAKILLGVGAPVLGFGLGGAVDFHRTRLAELLRLIQELAVSGLAAVAGIPPGVTLWESHWEPSRSLPRARVRLRRETARAEQRAGRRLVEQRLGCAPEHAPVDRRRGGYTRDRSMS